MSNPSINPATSASGYVVPSRLGVDGPRRRADTPRSGPPRHPISGIYAFLRLLRDFTPSFFPQKPGTLRRIRDAPAPHPGFFLRKSFPSHILNFHPTLCCLAGEEKLEPRYPAERDCYGLGGDSRFPGFAP